MRFGAQPELIARKELALALLRHCLKLVRERGCDPAEHTQLLPDSPVTLVAQLLLPDLGAEVSRTASHLRFVRSNAITPPHWKGSREATCLVVDPHSF